MIDRIKQQIAETHGFSDFKSMINNVDLLEHYEQIDAYYSEVMHAYADEFRALTIIDKQACKSKQEFSKFKSIRSNASEISTSIRSSVENFNPGA